LEPRAPQRSTEKKDLTNSVNLEIDLLTCPKCEGRIKIIRFIEDEEVIEKTLKHFGLWDVKDRSFPRAKARSVTIYLNESESPDFIPRFLLPARILITRWIPI
jgi:hypothetical protein